MSFKIKKSLMLKLPKPRRRLRIRRKKRSLQNPQLGAPSQDGRTGRKKNLSLVGRKARSHIVTGCWNQNLRAGWRRGWMWRWALRPPHSAKDSSRALLPTFGPRCWGTASGNSDCFFFSKSIYPPGNRKTKCSRPRWQPWGFIHVIQEEISSSGCLAAGHRSSSYFRLCLYSAAL